MWGGRSLPPAGLVLLGRVFSCEMLRCLVLVGLPFGGDAACVLSRGLVCNWFPQLQHAEVNYRCDNEDKK